MPQEIDASARARRRGRRAAALVLGLLLAPLLAEGLWRLRLFLGGEAYDRFRLLTELVEMRGRAGGEFVLPEGRAPENDEGWVPHPFVGFELDRTGAQIEKDLARQAEHPDDYVVLVTGGSVAAIFDYHGAARFEELLAADAALGARRVRRLNYARPAFKQPQPLNQLNYLLARGLRPDCVLEIDGLNELVLSNLNASAGVHPSWPSARPWSAALGNSRLSGAELEIAADAVHARRALATRVEIEMDRNRWFHSALYGSRAIGRLRALERRMVELAERWTELGLAREEDRELAGPRFEGGEEQLVAQAVELWKQASISMWAACEARGIRYLHVLQPTLHDPGSKHLTPAEIATSTVRPEWTRAVELGYPRLRAAGQELAGLGVPFLDATQVFAGFEGDIYHDPCHFRLPGCALLAEAIAPALLALERD